MSTAALMIGDSHLRGTVGDTLAQAGYACVIFASTTALLRGSRSLDLDLIVAEVDCGGDWRALLQQRGRGLAASVALILVGPTETGASALDAGADDFVSRSVASSELVARIQRAARRRSQPEAAMPLRHAGCEIDESSCSLKFASGRVGLTSRELAVARILFAHPGEAVSRRHLAVGVWGCDEELIGRSIEQHMYQLRRKLKRCAGSRLALRGVYGGGYRLDIIDGPRPSVESSSAERRP